MFGKLGRFLRLLGFDTEIANSKWKDDRILRRTLQTNQILITRDKLFFNQAQKKLHKTGINSKYALYINKQEIIGELTGIFDHLSINPSKFIWNDPEKLSFKPRCSICNSKLISVHKNEIENQIQEGTFNRYNNFWKCSNPKCKKIYWVGSHWDEIKRILEEVSKNFLSKIN